MAEPTEKQLTAGRVAYAKEKLRELKRLETKARGDLRIAKIEVEIAESKVETQEAMVDFAEAAVRYQEGVVVEAESGHVPSAPEPAPTAVSPPQDEPPGAGVPPTPPASTPPPSAPPADPPKPGEFDPANPPAVKSHARAAWNIEATRRLLREQGTVRAAAIRETIQLGAGAARLAIQALIDSGEVLKTGNRASTQYHWQGTFEEEPGGAEAMSGSTRTEPPARTGPPVQPDAPPTPPAVPPGGRKEQKFPVSQGPPPLVDGRRPQSEPEDESRLAAALKHKAGRGRTSKGGEQEPSFQGLMHQRLVIKPMTIEQMLVEWPGRSEQEIRQALGENMKTGDVALKHKGGESRYHGRP